MKRKGWEKYIKSKRRFGRDKERGRRLKKKSKAKKGIEEI